LREKNAIKLFFGHFVRGSKRIDAGIVDENIDPAISKFDGSLRDGACAGCVLKIGGNEIRFASCGLDFVDCLLAALRIAPHHNHVDAKLCEFPGCCATNSARSSCDQCGRTISRHVQLPCVTAD